jgi:hypothetical protein
MHGDDEQVGQREDADRDPERVGPEDPDTPRRTFCINYPL